MIILKALGSFFVKIWRWIKDTAWVQPLLIVGAIFAIIFSIPSITSWANSWNFGSTGAYYNSYKVSLEGETDKPSESASPADVFTNNVYQNSLVAYGQQTGTIDKDSYGEKFFLLYVGTDCDACNKAEPAFKWLNEKWNSTLVPSDGRELKVHTIFSDEKSSNDADYTNVTGYSAFQRYLYNHTDFFNQTSSVLTQAPYKIHEKVSDDNYTYYEQPELTKFSTPAILLVDYSDEAIAQKRGGVSEILFGISGTTQQDKASVLLQMWNHTDTGDKGSSNPFSTSYIATN
jgi:hypothetical protein